MACMARSWIQRRRFCLALLVTGAALGGAAFAEPAFFPLSPAVMAQGGASTAEARGYDALFTNPAGFSRTPGSLTVLTTSAWMYGNPARLFGTLGDPSPQAAVDTFTGEVTGGGAGFGAAAGIGYVGRGLGLGLTLVTDSYLYGPTVLGASGDASVTLGAVAGFALPINLAGVKLHLGADFRPMARVRAPINDQTAFDLLAAMQDGGDPLTQLGSVAAFHGFAFGLDLGAIAELGGFRLGLAVRDFLGTRFSYGQSTVEDILGSLQSSLAFPTSPAAPGEYLIPMDVRLGFAWHPDLGAAKKFIDPVLQVDLQDIVGVLQDKRSPWALLHLGAEVELLSFLTLRAGLNQGYVTLGAGMKLLLLDVSGAVFTREMGKHLGDRPNSGMILEGAIRL